MTVWCVAVSPLLLVAGILLGYKLARVNQLLNDGIAEHTRMALVEDAAEMAIDGEPKVVHLKEVEQ